MPADQIKVSRGTRIVCGEALLAYAELLAQHHGKTIRGEYENGIIHVAERYCRSNGTLSERRIAFGAISASCRDVSAYSTTPYLQLSTGPRPSVTPACTWMVDHCRRWHSMSLLLWSMLPVSASWILSSLRCTGNDSTQSCDVADPMDSRHCYCNRSRSASYGVLPPKAACGPDRRCRTSLTP